MTTETIGVEIVEKNSATNELTKAVKALAKELENSQGKTDKAAKATKQYGDTSEHTGKQVTGFGAAVKGVTGSFSTFQGAVAGVLGAMSVSKLIGYADTFTNMENKMKLATKGQAELSAGMKNSFNIAQETRTKFEDVAGIYGKVTEALRTMNRPASDAAAITKTIAQAVAISGTSADTAANGLKQFEQALGSGALRGDEFNSVMENTPGLAKAIAEGMGVPVGALRALAEAGTLTSAQLVDALTKAAGAVNGAFAGMAPTIQQAWIVIENATVNYIGQANKASNFTGILAKVMIGLANNINIVVPALIALAAAVAIVGITALIGQIASLAVGFTSLVVAIVPATAAVAGFVVAISPIIAAVGAVVGVIYLVNEVLKQFGTSILDVIQKLADLIGLGERFKALRDSVAGTMDEVGKKVDEAGKFFKDTGKSAVDSAKKLADFSGGAGKAGKSLAELNKEAQKSGKFLNSFGEDVDSLFGGVKKLDKALDEGGYRFSEYYQNALNASGANDNLAGSIGGANGQLSSQVAAANSASGALQGYAASANQAAAATSRFSDLASGLGNIRDAARAAADTYSGPVAGGGPPKNYTSDYNGGLAGGSLGGMANPDYGGGGTGSVTSWHYAFDAAKFGDISLSDATPIMLDTYSLQQAVDKNAVLVQRYAELSGLLKELQSAMPNKTAQQIVDMVGPTQTDMHGSTRNVDRAIDRARELARGSGSTPSSGGSASSGGAQQTNNAVRPIQVVINTPDANSFRNSEKQLKTDMLRELQRGMNAA